MDSDVSNGVTEIKIRGLRHNEFSQLTRFSAVAYTRIQFEFNSDMRMHLLREW